MLWSKIKIPIFSNSAELSMLEIRSKLRSLCGSNHFKATTLISNQRMFWTKDRSWLLKINCELLKRRLIVLFTAIFTCGICADTSPISGGKNILRRSFPSVKAAHIHRDMLFSRSQNRMSRIMLAHTVWLVYNQTFKATYLLIVLYLQRQILAPDSQFTIPDSPRITIPRLAPPSAGSLANNRTLSCSPENKRVLQAEEAHISSSRYVRWD